MRAAASSVFSRSSGWTKSMNGRLVSSSTVQPSVRSQAGLRSIRKPSALVVPSMSADISKSRPRMWGTLCIGGTDIGER